MNTRGRMVWPLAFWLFTAGTIACSTVMVPERHAVSASGDNAPEKWQNEEKMREMQRKMKELSEGKRRFHRAHWKTSEQCEPGARRVWAPYRDRSECLTVEDFFESLRLESPSREEIEQWQEDWPALVRDYEKQIEDLERSSEQRKRQWELEQRQEELEPPPMGTPQQSGPESPREATQEMSAQSHEKECSEAAEDPLWVDTLSRVWAPDDSGG